MAIPLLISSYPAHGGGQRTVKTIYVSTISDGSCLNPGFFVPRGGPVDATPTTSSCYAINEEATVALAINDVSGGEVAATVYFLSSSFEIFSLVNFCGSISESIPPGTSTLLLYTSKIATPGCVAATVGVATLEFL